jgi:hypothetical protein
MFAALADPARRHRRPGRRLGARAAAAGRSAAHSAAAGRDRGTDDRRARRTRPHPAGHLDHRAVRLGAAAILAQTGDPRRFASARALVKHAGLAPREKLSGAFVGRTKLTGQGRPGLGIPTSQPRLRRPIPTPDQPRAEQTLPNPRPNRHRRRDRAPPARRDHHRQDLGSGHRHPRQPSTIQTSHRRLTSCRGASSWRSGRALRGIETPADLDAHHGQPRPSSHQPDHTLPGPTPFSYAGTDDGRGTDPTLDAQRLTLMSGRLIMHLRPLRLGGSP